MEILFSKKKNGNPKHNVTLNEPSIYLKLSFSLQFFLTINVSLLVIVMLIFFSLGGIEPRPSLTLSFNSLTISSN